MTRSAVMDGALYSWMNVARYLKNREDKESRQILFEGDPLTMKAVWQLRDELLSPQHSKNRSR